MTAEAAMQICAVYRLQDDEQRVYEALLAFLSQAAAEPRVNLFPILLRALADGLAAQLVDESSVVREGRLVQVEEAAEGETAGT